jgi:hypothetical protein
MVITRIKGGPSWEEVVRRMCAHAPVAFQTATGAFEVLIDEMWELDAKTARISFHGSIVLIGRTDCGAFGDYNCLSRTGNLTCPKSVVGQVKSEGH